MAGFPPGPALVPGPLSSGWLRTCPAPRERPASWHSARHDAGSRLLARTAGGVAPLPGRGILSRPPWTAYNPGAAGTVRAARDRWSGGTARRRRPNRDPEPGGRGCAVPRPVRPPIYLAGLPPAGFMRPICSWALSRNSSGYWMVGKALRLPPVPRMVTVP